MEDHNIGVYKVKNIYICWRTTLPSQNSPSRFPKPSR